MGKVRIVMGSKSPKEIAMPNLANLVECNSDESIFYFGNHIYEGGKYRLFYALGVVCRIAKGDNCDILTLNFGIHSKHPQKRVIVMQNHARRQILTLKRGQVAQIFGVAIYKKRKFKDSSGKETTKTSEIMYAKGINGWYVPTMIDIKKTPLNEDFVALSNYEKKVVENNLDVLDLFTNDKGEEI